MDLDYKKLGFKAGIEIHQQLNTSKKLFSAANTTMLEKNLQTKIVRKLRSAAGETGVIDTASMYEQIRDRTFVYHGYENEFDLVDLDEQPPFPVNPKAFNIALGVAKLFKLNTPNTICVMRKTVTDGSAVSGFQRTILIGFESANSILKTSKGPVKVNQLNLEEYASKIMNKENNTINYSLSRLGVPLLEIGTDASIKDPSHVKEVALKIGTMLRSFNVKRGIGTIRQDVNVSIKEGARIEVKGWQDLKKIEELVKNEALRQYNLIEIKKALKKRKLGKFSKQTKDVTNIFKRSESKIISGLIRNNASIFALVLPKFSDLLKKELCPKKTFGKELSEYAKAYGTKGMIHTDEDLSKYKLEKEFKELRKVFKSKEEDLILIIGGKKNTAENAIKAVYNRALYCLIGVPEETRIPNHSDATNSYARPLPGSNRMYPETDVPNIRVENLDKIKLPELVSGKISRFKKQFQLDENTANELIRNFDNFEDYVGLYKKIEPKFIAYILVEIPKEIQKRYRTKISITEHADEVLLKLSNNEISKEAVLEILVEKSQGKKIDYAKYKILSDKDLKKEIKKIISDNKNAPFNALIGKVMAKLRGKAPGKKIVDIVKELC